MSKTTYTWEEWEAIKAAQSAQTSEMPSHQERLEAYKAIQAKKAEEAAQERSDWQDECQRRWRGETTQQDEERAAADAVQARIFPYHLDWLAKYKAEQREKAAQAAQERSDWQDECQRRWRGQTTKSDTE